MTEPMPTAGGPRLARIEPEDRLVVLVRTLHAPDAAQAAALREGVARSSHLGQTCLGQNCLGQALYRHRSFYQNPSGSPAWTHVELSYFRDIVPADVLEDLVFARPPDAADLIRAEILLTTPRSFILPRDWQGLGTGSGRVASLEFIHVQPDFLGDYRRVMRDYCGPAAARLVGSGRFATFRSMETAAVLHRAPGLDLDWNQIHLCELCPDGFSGFGAEFRAALRDGAPGTTEAADAPDVFAGLDRMRWVPRWTFNDAVIEADAAVAAAGRREP